MKLPLTRVPHTKLKLYWPVVPVTVEGIENIPMQEFYTVIDTGSHITHFPGGQPIPDTGDTIGGVGDKEVNVMPVELKMTIRQDGWQFQWQTKAWVSENERDVFGYAAFLEYFTITINSESNEVVIEPNKNFNEKFPRGATKLFKGK